MKKFLRNTLFALAILLSVPFMLTACGEDEEQYTLEIHATLVGQGLTNEEKVITDAERRAFETKVAENSAAFQGAGVHTENEEFNINAPHIPNYKFVGWYEDNGEWIPSATGADIRWCMYGRDGYIEARYEPLCYNITYVFGPVSGGEFNPQPEHSNPTYHNCIKHGPFTLIAPTVDNYTFDHWEYSIDGQIYSGFTTLPTLEEELRRSNDVFNENPIEDIVIFGVYEHERCTITLSYEHLTSISLWTGNAQDECDIIEIVGNQATIEYGKNLVIKYEAEDGYNIDSRTGAFKVNGEPYTSASTTRCDISEVTGNITITIIPECV